MGRMGRSERAAWAPDYVIVAPARLPIYIGAFCVGWHTHGGCGCCYWNIVVLCVVVLFSEFVVVYVGVDVSRVCCWLALYGVVPRIALLLSVG